MASKYLIGIVMAWSERRMLSTCLSSLVRKLKAKVIKVVGISCILSCLSRSSLGSVRSSRFLPNVVPADRDPYSFSEHTWHSLSGYGTQH